MPSEVEQYCLNRIKLFLLRLEGRSVYYYHCRRRRWSKKVPNIYKGRTRYQFKYDGRVGVVYANRLVWMLIHRRAIPDECRVDHIDGNRRNDSPDNLRLMSTEDSNRQGSEVTTDNKLGKLCRWFDFVGRHGREPSSPAEEGFVETGF